MGGGFPLSLCTLTTSPSSPLFCRCLQLPAHLPLILALFFRNMLILPPTLKFLRICTNTKQVVPVWWWLYKYQRPKTRNPKDHGVSLLDTSCMALYSDFLLVKDECQAAVYLVRKRVLLRDRDAAKLASGAWLQPRMQISLCQILCAKEAAVPLKPDLKGFNIKIQLGFGKWESMTHGAHLLGF